MSLPLQQFSGCPARFHAARKIHYYCPVTFTDKDIGLAQAGPHTDKYNTRGRDGATRVHVELSGECD
jgi:hypothetical protein